MTNFCSAVSPCFGHTVRSHWLIDNSPHWVLDVTRIGCAIAKGNSAACLVVRRLDLNIGRMHPEKRSIRHKFTAQSDDDFLLGMTRRIRKHDRRGILNAIALPWRRNFW